MMRYSFEVLQCHFCHCYRDVVSGWDATEVNIWFFNGPCGFDCRDFRGPYKMLETTNWAIELESTVTYSVSL